MKENLKAVLKMFADFSGPELNKIENCFKPKSFEKGSTLLQAGSVCKEFYFVQAGCLRTYFIDKNGYEKTRYVMLENYIGTALASFIAQKPSIEFIEALDDTEILSINHSDFYSLNQEMNSWKNFYQRILEMAYSFQTRKIEQLVTLSAKQRYQQLLQESPVLVQKLSNKVLASYLDIKPETLSRLKSK